MKNKNLILIIGIITLLNIFGFASALAIGDRVEVYNTGSSGLHVLSPNACSSSIGGKFDGALGTITDGPSYCSYHNRWKINWDGGLTGWSAESWLRKVSTCNPKTCSQLGKQCGGWDNGCQQSIDCGTCSFGQTCSNGQCVNSCTNQCSSGSSRCNGDVKQVCVSSNGCYAWGGGVSCTYGCSNNNCNSAPTCTNECSSGETRCNGYSKQSCGDYDSDSCLEWGGDVSCTNGCAFGQCLSCTSKTCSQLGKQCGGWDNGCQQSIDCGSCSSGQTCNSNGQCENNCNPNWNCGSWSTCTNNQQTRTCTDTNNCGTNNGKPALSQSCTPTCTNECSSGETRCNGQTSETCIFSNGCYIWGGGVSCNNGCRSSGVCNYCVPNSKYCDGNYLETCNSDGSGSSGIACSNGQTCSSGQCTGGCIPQSLSVTCGTSVCGNKVNNCGQTVSCGSCSNGQTCNSNGVCVNNPEESCGPSIFPELFIYSSQNNKNLYNALSNISLNFKNQNVVMTPELLASVVTTLEKEVGGYGFLPVEEYGDYGMGRGCSYNIKGRCRSSPYEGGVDYKGRGYIQITGKWNYQIYCGSDCVGNSKSNLNVCGCKNKKYCSVTNQSLCPQIKALNPNKAAQIFVNYYKGKNILYYVNKNDFYYAGYLINGGISYANDFNTKVKNRINLFNANKDKTNSLISCLSA